MKFSENYDSRCQVVLISHKSSKDQKKGLYQKLKDISFLNQVKTKQKRKKKSLPQFGTIFGRNWWDLFVLIGTFSSVHPPLKSRWGEADSRWGDASPYALTTAFLVCNILITWPGTPKLGLHKPFISTHIVYKFQLYMSSGFWDTGELINFQAKKSPFFMFFCV